MVGWATRLVKVFDVERERVSMNLDQLGYPGRAGAGLKGKNGVIRTRGIRYPLRCIRYQGIRYQGRKERWDRAERMAGESLVRVRAKGEDEDEDELANSCYFGRHDRRGQRGPQTARLDGGS